MISYRLKEKQFRPVTLYLQTQNDVDMLEIICDAVVKDKVTSAAQSAAKELIAIINEINKDQGE